MDKNNKTMTWIIAVATSAAVVIFTLAASEIFSFFMENSFLWKGIAWSIFLVGTGGAIIFGEKFSGEKQRDEIFFKAQIGLSLIGGSSAVLIYFLMVIRNNFILYGETASASIFFTFFSILIILSVGFFFGMAFYALIKISEEKSFSRRWLVFGHGLGIFLGFAFFSFLISSFLSEMAWAFLAGAINSLLAVISWLFFGGKKKIFKLGFNTAIFITVLFAFSFQSSGEWEQHFLKKYYYYQESGKNLKAVFSSTSGFPEVKRIKSGGKKIDLVKINKPSISDLVIKTYSGKLEKYPDFPQDYGIFLDGREYYFANYEDAYFDYLIHLPMILNSRIPEKVLVIGDFSGSAARELEKYPEIKEIIQLGLRKEAVTFAKNDEILKKINRNSMDDPRIRFVTEDAFKFIKNTKEQFNAVFLCLPLGSNAEFSRFFSKEFFNIVGEKLKLGGFSAMSASREEINGTLEEAGMENAIFYQSGFEEGNGNALITINDLIDKEIIVEGVKGEKISDKPQAIRDILRESLDKFRKNFVFFKKTSNKPKVSYQGFGIEYTLLNEERFYASFVSDPVTKNLAENNQVISLDRIDFPTVKKELYKVPY